MHEEIVLKNYHTTVETISKKKHFGIWSDSSKQYVFGIDEPSKSKAWKALRKHIGTDSYKWRFRVKQFNRRGNKLEVGL